MKNIFLGFATLLSASFALAKAAPVTVPTLRPATLEASSETTPRPVHVMLAYGSEIRPQKNVDSQYQEKSLTNYSFGIGYQQFIFIFEKAEFSESSGNATLNVESTFEDYLLWGQYRALSWNYLAPYIGFGLGTYKETVKTTFMGSAKKDESPGKMLGGLAVGVGLDVPVLWFSLEARFLFGDELERQPTLGGLARVGIQF